MFRKITVLVLLLQCITALSQSDYIFDPGFRMPDGSTYYYKFAILPTSSDGTGEILIVKLMGGGFVSGDKKIESMYFSNRGGFKAFAIERIGNIYNTSVRIEAYNESDNSISVYLVMDSLYLHGKIFASTSGISSGNILKENPPKLTSTPSGVKVFSSSEQTNSLLINSNGNIAVRGKLEAKEVKVTLTPTADFVFEEDYDLPSLDSIEKFIMEHKHLPEIATASEMEMNGVDIGSFQIQLLQKIEELTLYTIQQQKEIDSLRSIVEKVQFKLNLK